MDTVLGSAPDRPRHCPSLSATPEVQGPAARHRFGERGALSRAFLDEGQPIVVRGLLPVIPKRRLARQGQAGQRSPDRVDCRLEPCGEFLHLDPRPFLDLDGGLRLGELTEGLAETGRLLGLPLLSRGDLALNETRERLELARLSAVLLDQVGERLRDAGVLDPLFHLHLVATEHPILLQQGG